jgi:hypothetical protein
MNAGTKKFLFVGGISRSGTSTMAELLRAHPAIAMGRERYARLFREGDAFVPALFEKERFCLQHRSDDSHHLKPQDYYRELYPRFDQCVYVGDKLPRLYKRYRYVLATFAGCRIIYMARNVVEVAQSYQGRALKTRMELASGAAVGVSRLWSPERDWRKAVDEWNDSIEQTLALGRLPQLFVANYDLLYNDERLLHRLLDFLELPAAPAMLDYWRSAKRQREHIESNRKPLLNDTEIGEIRGRAKLTKFDQLLQRFA